MNAGSPQSSPRLFPQSSPIASPLTSPTVHPSPIVQPSPFTPKLFTSSSNSSISDCSAASPPKKRKKKVFRSTVKRRLLTETNSSEDECYEASESEQQVVAPIDADLNQDHYRNRHLSNGGLCSANSDNSINEAGNSDTNDSDSSSSDAGSSSAALSVEASTDISESDLDSDSSENDNINHLFEGSDMTADEGLLEVLKVYVKERWTKTSLDKVIKLFKRMLPEPNAMPTSGKAALNQIYKLSSSNRDTEFFYCEICQQLWDKDSSKCSTVNCPGETYGKFYIFSLEDQIRHMFEQRNLADVLDHHKQQSESKEGYICDISDGSEYKRVKEYLTGKYDLVLLWNTDGVALSGSSSVELWPILATICEVPPRLRASYLIVCGIYIGKKKPNMNVFLKPFTESLIKVWVNQVSWTHPSTKVSHSTSVVAPCLCADAPARAIVQQIMNNNSRFGCNTCEQKTRKTNEPVVVQKKNNEIVMRKKRVFFFEENSAPLRRGCRMDLQGELAQERGKSRKGVVGPAEISNIPLLDRAKCICAEYLHLVAIGVVKSLLSLIFFTQGPWYIGEIVPEIDDFINKISVPDFIKRLSRGICDFKHWKASEFRSFLLFYSLPVFKDRLPDIYFQHWLLLVQSMFILLKDAISLNELESADLMLRSFVRDIKRLYGEKNYTYNLHTLSHICELTKRWGPIWATSAFMFENFNGFISAHLHGTKHLGKELINNIRIAEGITILDNIVNATRVFNPSRSLVTALMSKPLEFEKLTDAEKSFLNNAKFGTFCLYERVKLKGEIYSGKQYDCGKKRANSYVQFKTEAGNMKYGQVSVFVNGENGQLFALLNVFKIDHVNVLFHTEGQFVIKNLKPVKYSNSLIIVPVDSIVTKVLKVGMFLGIRPNSFEVNL